MGQRLQGEDMDGEARSRVCPFCSVQIDAQATLCAHCGRFSTPLNGQKPTVRKKLLIERANLNIEQWESSNASAINILSRQLQLKLPIPRVLTVVIGTAPLVVSLLILLKLWKDYGLGSVQNVLSLWILGLMILTWPLLCRNKKETPLASNSQTRSNSSLYFLGYENNLVLLQFCAVAVAMASGFLSEIDQAWNACIIALVLTPLLFRTKMGAISVVLGSIAAIYLAYLLAAWGTAFELTSMLNALDRPYFLSLLEPIIWIMMVIATIPQLQIPRLNKFGLGQLKGDIEVTVLGTRVTVAVASAVLIWCVWDGFWLTLRWLSIGL